MTTRDYRLFDIQHAVVPTTLPLDEFYRELVRTQAVINLKHLSARTAFGALRVLGANLAHGQANFARVLWRFNKVYNADRKYADHQQPVRYELPLPPQLGHRRQLYVHSRAAAPRRNRSAAPGPGRA
jgi:hopanoid C-3 methylase